MEFDAERVKSAIRDVQDFPKKGILFRDITPLLKDPILFESCIDEFARRISGKEIDYIVGVEARGFIIGTALAIKLKKGFIPIRKKGKLPHSHIETTYNLEYGIASMEMHEDAMKKGDNVILVDDLLATGGTLEAATKLINQLGANLVAYLFLVELQELHGRERLQKEKEIVSLIKY